MSNGMSVYIVLLLILYCNYNVPTASNSNQHKKNHKSKKSYTNNLILGISNSIAFKGFFVLPCAQNMYLVMQSILQIPTSEIGQDL